MNIVRKIFRSGVTPKDAIDKLTKHLHNLIAVDPENEDQKEHLRHKVATDLAQIRFMLLGDPETPPDQAHAQKLVEGLLLVERGQPESSLCVKLLSHAQLYPADAQKEAATIVKYVFRKHNAEFKQACNGNWQGFVQLLLEAYGNSDPRLQIQVGSILREMMKLEEPHAYLLTQCDELRHLLLANADSANFDVSSDAFATLTSLLTTNKMLVARFLEDRFSEFFAEFHVLIKSANYATRRQSLWLLWTILLDDTNRPTMMRYISDKYNLQLLMMMLQDPSNAVPFEAFQMFKVFVANRNPSPDVYRTLYANKAKLVEFLTNFQTDVKRNPKERDQLAHEKGLLLTKLRKKMDRTPQEYEADFNSKAKKVHVK